MRVVLPPVALFLDIYLIYSCSLLLFAFRKYYSTRHNTVGMLEDS
jgi:hypothetical protein